MMSKSAFARSRESHQNQDHMQRKERAGVTISTSLDSGLRISGTKIDSAIDNLLNSTISGFHLLPAADLLPVVCFVPTSVLPPEKAGTAFSRAESRRNVQRARPSNCLPRSSCVIGIRPRKGYNGSQSERVSHLSFKNVLKNITQPNSEINNAQPR
jgi:hypothetical protein